MNLERAKELLHLMVDFLAKSPVGGEEPSIEETINLLILIGFTEEELVDEFGITESDIESMKKLFYEE